MNPITSSRTQSGEQLIGDGANGLNFFSTYIQFPTPFVEEPVVHVSMKGNSLFDGIYALTVINTTKEGFTVLAMRVSDEMKSDHWVQDLSIYWLAIEADPYNGRVLASIQGNVQTIILEIKIDSNLFPKHDALPHVILTMHSHLESQENLFTVQLKEIHHNKIVIILERLSKPIGANSPSSDYIKKTIHFRNSFPVSPYVIVTPRLDPHGSSNEVVIVNVQRVTPSYFTAVIKRVTNTDWNQDLYLSYCAQVPLEYGNAIDTSPEYTRIKSTLTRPSIPIRKLKVEEIASRLSPLNVSTNFDTSSSKNNNPKLSKVESTAQFIEVSKIYRPTACGTQASQTDISLIGEESLDKYINSSSNDIDSLDDNAIAEKDEFKKTYQCENMLIPTRIIIRTEINYVSPSKTYNLGPEKQLVSPVNSAIVLEEEIEAEKANKEKYPETIHSTVQEKRIEHEDISDTTDTLILKGGKGQEPQLNDLENNVSPKSLNIENIQMESTKGKIETQMELLGSDTEILLKGKTGPYLSNERKSSLESPNGTRTAYSDKEQYSPSKESHPYTPKLMSFGTIYLDPSKRIDSSPRVSPSAINSPPPSPARSLLYRIQKERIGSNQVDLVREYVNSTIVKLNGLLMVGIIEAISMGSNKLKALEYIIASNKYEVDGNDVKHILDLFSLSSEKREVLLMFLKNNSSNYPSNLHHGTNVEHILSLLPLESMRLEILELMKDNALEKKLNVRSIVDLFKIESNKNKAKELLGIMREVQVSQEV
jgi:hypothetical protein